MPNTGLQASQTGPLTEEPLMGVAFELIAVEATSTGSTSDAGFSGQLLLTVKECLKWAFLSQPVRLMTAMYGSTKHATSTFFLGGG